MTVNEKNEGMYSRAGLTRVYTPFVIRFSHRFAWRVSNEVLHRNHREHIGQTHVTVGPGNGYFLSKLPADTRLRTLHLLDINRTCLDVAAEQLRSRFDVHTHEQDALKPWPLADASVDSVDSHMVLHTFRGDGIQAKAGLVAEAARVLKPGGRFFGCTILSKGEGVRKNWLARRLLALYNGQKNTFSNAGDSADDLRAVLEKHFEPGNVDFRVDGCVGIWVVTR
ncbi:class I SAM-dependent methyltransferase [Marinitenerispora sediminis]|uniref:Class I SAM-dependent methyltransferase n=1 Tax=Marinitenerispora sediminis TaxID=1931232 RepID=A0A368TAB2_9ACTN|nr:class I SAM-dependent methyltransferase [Marinitenerispora sediminis]RCV59019.1 class I SAM-dependent methyltransferase [Marinitenerispora sediminis]RCV61553.1 class I SAM-dependent methyltransferase [Marinitenerispora sediminis]